jgi:hypothetical protein
MNDFRLIGSRPNIKQLLLHLLGDGHAPVQMFKRTSTDELIIHCEAKTAEMNDSGNGGLDYQNIHPESFALLFLAAQFRSAIALYVAVEGKLKLTKNGKRGMRLTLTNNTGYGTSFAVNGDPEKSAKSERILRQKHVSNHAVHIGDIYL